MDVRLPIYKNSGSSLVIRTGGFDVERFVDWEIPLSQDLTVSYDYVISIDYYTDAPLYLQLYAGSTLLLSFNKSEGSHKMQTETFTYPGGTLKLHFYYPGHDVNIIYAHVSELAIRRLTSPGTVIRYIAEAWEFHDTVMGERYVSLNATYHAPIDWEIGDYVIYRGQRYYLNTVPTATQNARSGEAGDSFVYENLKFDSEQGKMYDCMVLDITPTTGDYVASRGTNYTGSSSFTIYCAETTIQMKDTDGVWHDVTLSPVAYLAGLAQANLNRLYPQDNWRVDVNPDLPHMDDKVISISKWYVPQLLAEIHNQWKVDYVVIGNTIKIGYTLNNITGGDDEAFLFGYGEGYAQRGDDGKSLFQIKRTLDSSRRIITRLRAMGSTRNMPYRYYNKKYQLPQAMFVANLQLPDTFATPSVKATNNATRDSVYGIGDDGYPNLRHVLGDSNDAYVDKHDNAEGCDEGVREGAAAWDGSDSELEEIYPTIKSGTYRDLRGANIPDMSGRYPSTVGAQNAYPGYDDDERIDEILDVDHRTNVGDGIMTESDAKNQYNIVRTAKVDDKTLVWSSGSNNCFDVENYVGTAKTQYRDTLLTIDDVLPGKYQLVPVTQNVKFFVKYSASSGDAAVASYRFTVYATDKETGTTKKVAEKYSSSVNLTSGEDYVSIEMPTLPNPNAGPMSGNDRTLEIKSASDIRVEVALEIINTNSIPYGSFIYKIDSDEEDVVPEYVWSPQDVTDTFLTTPFCLYLKDIGVDLSTVQTTGEDATIHMNTGACGGMDFKWNPNTVQKVLVEGREAWKIEITERFTDDAIHVYYPNAESPILPGDNYVLLNIEFPEVYIKLAEMRLLEAATSYLKDNCEPKYVYEPSISELYIQRNIDYWEALGAPASSVYWNLYAGFKFSLRGIPNSDDEELPVLDNITIKTVTIKEGEQDVPVVELVLNDELDQSSIQKLTVSVDRIYNSLFGSNGTGSLSYSTLFSLLNSEGAKIFLSKKKNDEAEGTITFKKGLDSEGSAKFGDYSQDASGAGIYKDGDGNWHVESDFLHVRKKFTAKEVQVEDVSHIGGQQLLTAAQMTCDFVVEYESFYRCFFLRKGSDGKETKNQWKIGDQAYVCTFNLEKKEGGVTGNHYLWRRVVGTSNTLTDNNDYDVNGVMAHADDYHFIDLSKTVASENSDAPCQGDNIVQLGHQDGDTDRENAIIIAGAGTSSPYIRQFTGITTFTLPEPSSQLKPGDNKLTGQVTMQAGSKFPDGSDVEEYLDGMSSGNENLLLNTGFTGDYETVSSDDGVLTADTPVFSNPLKHWDSINATVVADAVSASGYAVDLSAGRLSQEATKPLMADEDYCLSFRASGSTMRVTVGGHTESFTLSGTVTHHVIKFKSAGSAYSTLMIDQATAHIMEIQLVKGSIPNSDWLPSQQDNSKAVAYYQSLSYLSNAINNASTSILGGLILSQIIQVGNYRNGVMSKETGGMSGVYSSENSPFLWGGGTMEKAFYTIGKYANDPSYQPTDEEVANMAKFVVTHGGRAILNDIVLRGYIYALGGFFRGEIQATGGSFQSSNNGNTISINASNGDFKMSGPETSLDESGYPPDPTASIIDFLKIAFMTDPDTLKRNALFALNAATGLKVEISPFDGITIITQSNCEINIKDDDVTITQVSGNDSYTTELTSNGISLSNLRNPWPTHGLWWKSVTLEQGGRLTLKKPDNTSISGTLSVDTNGFLILVNQS